MKSSTETSGLLATAATTARIETFPWRRRRPPCPEPEEPPRRCCSVPPLPLRSLPAPSRSPIPPPSRSRLRREEGADARRQGHRPRRRRRHGGIQSRSRSRKLLHAGDGAPIGEPRRGDPTGRRVLHRRQVPRALLHEDAAASEPQTCSPARRYAETMTYCRIHED
jgi:hypothetical protein